MPKVNSIVMPDGTEYETNGCFIGQYNVTTLAEYVEAYNAGRMLFCKKGADMYVLTEREDLDYFYFARMYAHSLHLLGVGASGWETMNGWYNAVPHNTFAIASGDRLAFVDASNSNYINGSTITFGSSTTQYLANNGTWQSVPAATSDLTNDSGFLTLADLPVWDGSVS